MTDMRDYEAWHRQYDDPDSELAWRLAIVRGYIGAGLDRTPGDIRALSVCSGDGRDILGTLAGRPDADRVAATLVEIHPAIARRARDAAAAAGLDRIEVRTVDAGMTDAYVGAVPADIVLLVGIFGNISPADLDATIDAAPQLCAPGAHLIWSRGRGRDGDELVNDRIRARFTRAGFTELDYAALERGRRPALGLMRYDGPGETLRPGVQLFTFVR